MQFWSGLSLWNFTIQYFKWHLKKFSPSNLSWTLLFTTVQSALTVKGQLRITNNLRCAESIMIAVVMSLFLKPVSTVKILNCVVLKMYATVVLLMNVCLKLSVLWECECACVYVTWFCMFKTHCFHNGTIANTDTSEFYSHFTQQQAVNVV